MKLSDEDQEILLEMGVEKGDFPQISEALSKTVFTFETKRINLTKAVELLGKRKFLSGMARSAFHFSACRLTDDERPVYFDSSKLFR